MADSNTSTNTSPVPNTEECAQPELEETEVVEHREEVKDQETAKPSVDKKKTTKGTASAEQDKKQKFLIRTEASEVKAIVEGDGTPEEKMKEVYSRFQQLVKEYKKQEKRNIETLKKVSEVTRQKDSVQNELTRTTAAKTKLEGLCREMQRQNKGIQEESRQRAYEEEKKRQEVSAKFQDTIDDVAGKLQEHYERNQELKEENRGLAQQLKSIVDQYETRESNFEKLIQQKQLELQLVEAKLAQQLVSLSQERETYDTEKQLLMVQVREYKKRCELLTEQEQELRKQVQLYSEKFEEFQETVTKSNKAFSTFKKEMDKMSDSVTHSEKEAAKWKSKFTKCNETVVKMAEQQVQAERSILSQKQKNKMLEELCRALQQERNGLNVKLKELTAKEDSGENQQSTSLEDSLD